MEKGKYLYTCFVDFQKTYDSIRRDNLKHKLQQLGIKGKFLDIITLIYSSTKVLLSYTSYVSTPFGTYIGLKQGDISRTMFFNLFINELPMQLEKLNIQSEENEPSELFNTQISSLLYSDDFAIFSLTKNGLQEKLGSLEKHCKQWDLNLNLKKTKVIKFNKQGNTTKKFICFIIGEKEIEIAKPICFFRFYICTIREKYVGIENLIKKDKKTWFSIKNVKQIKRENNWYIS